MMATMLLHAWQVCLILLRNRDKNQRLKTSCLWRFADPSNNAIGKIKRNHSICPDKDERDGLVKVNSGWCLHVEKGWLNIDGSLSAMFASWPDATQ